MVGYKISGQGEEHIVFKNASGFDSDFPATVAADAGTVVIEIRDQFTLDELANRFSGRSMPCKFAIVSAGSRTIVCEFSEKVP